MTQPTQPLANSYRIAPPAELPSDLHPYTRALAENAERRYQVIAGLRALANMLSDHPDLPTPYSIVAQAGPVGYGDEVGQRKAVSDAAAVLGQEVDRDEADFATVRAELGHPSGPYVAYVYHASWADPDEDAVNNAHSDVERAGRDKAAKSAYASGPVPMTGAEALDAAAQDTDVFAGTLINVVNALAQASRDEADREDAES